MGPIRRVRTPVESISSFRREVDENYALPD